jgi:hypothetical protein
MSSLHTHLHSFVLEAYTDSTLNAAQLKDVLLLALNAAKQTKRFGLVSSAWDPGAWADLLTQLAGAERFKSSARLHQMLRELVSLAQEGPEKVNGKDVKTNGGEDEEKGAEIVTKVTTAVEKATKKKRKVDAEGENEPSFTKKKTKKVKRPKADE